MASCPECKSEIGNAKRCGCGWQFGLIGKAAPLAYPGDPPRIDCCVEGCGQKSFVKIKTKFGWGNFCPTHYEDYFKNEAKESFTKMGLDRYHNETREQHIERIREYTKLIVKRMPRQEAA